MVFGIQDLEQDVQKFRQDIENAKAKYLQEYAEYVNITTDLENIAQKDGFLQEEVETIAKVFPEEREEGNNAISDTAKNLFYSALPFGLVSGISYALRRRWMFQVAKYDPDTVFQMEISLNNVRKSLRHSSAQRASAAKASKKLKYVRKIVRVGPSRIAMATKIAKFTAGVGGILAIVGIALAISSARKQKEYLEEQKDELQKHLDDFNSYIAEANDDTKNVIDVFSAYFDEFEIDVDGVFNDNKDGFLDENGRQKFDDAVSRLREALNGAVKRMGELDGDMVLANRRVDRYLSQGYKGKELIEEVVFDTELPEELVQRLYVFKLRETGSSFQKAIELSELPNDLIQKLYARSYLDDGKTVKETVYLSGLTEGQVRRIYASKLLDDQLDAENPNDIVNFKGIADLTGLSEEIVLEMQVHKIVDLPSSSEEEELEPELLTR